MLARPAGELRTRAVPGRCARTPRRGVVIVITAMLLIFIMGMIAFAVDFGVIALEKAKLQNAVDAAALAASQRIQEAYAEAAREINPTGDIASQVAAINALAVSRAKDMAVLVAELNGVYLNPETDVQFGNKTRSDGVTYGSPPYNVVKVTANRTNPDVTAPDGQLRLSFAPVLGIDKAALTASAASYVQTRDIVLVLDYSGSMNDDSEFVAMRHLGKQAVEQNMDMIYRALAESDVRFSDNPSKKKFPNVNSEGDKVFGDIEFGEGPSVPDEVSAIYALARAYMSQGMSRQQFVNYVNSRSTSQVNSAAGSQSENNVKQGGDRISQADVDWILDGNRIYSSRLNSALSALNSNKIATGIAEYLGVLEAENGKPAVPWPQEGLQSDEVTPRGTPSVNQNDVRWRDYVKWVRSNSDANRYGYRNKFGTRTMVAYMLGQKPGVVDSEDLHRAPMYPFHAMKEGTTAFLDFLRGLDFGDRVGVVSYAGPTWGDGFNRDTARFETHEPDDPEYPRMTDDYEEINDIQIGRQAAEYGSYTGIGYGVRKGRDMLAIAGRPDAQKVMLLMTDGIANRSSQFEGLPPGWKWSDYTDFTGNGSANYSTGDRHKQFAFVECMAAATTERTVLHTMSVGVGADRELMDALARAGGGLHVDVPGGGSIEEMQEQMLEAFSHIASSVPSAQLLRDGDY